MYDKKQIDAAKLNPSSLFKRPMDVVEASDMPASAKLAVLRAWEADERALRRAENEGMGGGEHAHLHKVQAALAHLGTVAEPAWGRSPHQRWRPEVPSGVEGSPWGSTT